MGLITRRPDLTDEAFREHWRQSHAKLVCARMPTLTRYIQNLVVDRSQKAIDYQRGILEVDGISQLFFASLADMRKSIAMQTLEELATDEAKFIDGLVVLTTLQNTVIEPAMAHGVKRMSFLRKRSDVSMETFQREWFMLHATLVKRLPGILGYRQNLVIDRQRNRFAASEDESSIGVDGVVELWFESTAAIEAAFRSLPGKTTMSHAQEFISEITTFMVECTEFIPREHAS